MKFTYTLLAIAIAGSAAAQGTVDLESRARLWRSQAGIAGVESLALPPQARHAAAAAAEQSMCYGFICLAPGTSDDVLTDMGVEVFSRRGNIVVAGFKASELDRIASTEGVERVQLGRQLDTKLNKAREATGVDKIHAGTDLPRAYTGKGVVCGIVDGGIDPNHINFKDADGNSRVKHLAFRRLNEAGTSMLTSEYTAEQMEKFATDDAATYHGTHTMGIMAGGYRSDVKLPQASGLKGEISISDSKNPYYGVATDADIVASCGTLQDAFIAMGVSAMLDYAYAERKPIVINLSLGSNLGPHNGDGMLSQYLTQESPYAIFCISAGNEGDMPIHIRKTFTEGDTELQTFIRPSYYTAAEQNIRSGSINIYSADETEFDVQGVVFNTARKRVAFRMPITGNTEGIPSYWVSDAGFGDGTVTPAFAKAFDGYFGLGSMIDELDFGDATTDKDVHNRFYALLDYMVRDNAETNADGNYLIGFTVTGKPGQTIDVYCDGMTTDLSGYGYEGWTDGSLNGTISDLATTKNCVIVGSYDTRDNWLSLDGNAYGFEGLFKDGTISEFSSFGTTLDGRNLPHICAPGATIISSTSTPFVINAGNGIGPAYLNASAVNGDRTDYWEQMAGTSMASPLVAGSIALWLEADHTLTSEEVIDIITRTATVDDDVRTTGDPVQWGAGKFNAYEGLKAVLNKSGLANVKADGSDAVISSAGDRRYKVLLPGAEGVSVNVFDTTGRTVASVSSADGETEVSLAGVASGVYIFSVNGKASKVAVR